MKTVAKHWHVIDEGNKRVECDLCPHHCKLKEGQYGICGVRKNEDGKLITFTYGTLISAAVDPIEKKPLYHFLPGHATFTIATPGCNFKCLGCQNWEISQVPPKVAEKTPIFLETFIPPEAVVEKAIQTGCKSISFSYTEPTIYFEYMLDIARIAKQRGLKTVMVSNAFIEEKPLEELLEVIDAFAYDLKFFSDEAYRKYAKGRLEPVLRTIKRSFEADKWVEITTLLVPQYLDETQIKDIAYWIRDELAPWVPWHVSRFFPYYKAQDLPPTPMEMIEFAVRVGKEAGLYYVYAGNIPHTDWENTYCPKCGELLIERFGYTLKSYNLKPGGICPKCGRKTEGVFE